MLDLQAFNVSNNALTNHEEVIVLGTSENPENGEEDYFIHMIVKSLKTDDTVNVLFIGPREIYGREIKHFISPEDVFFDASGAKTVDITRINKVYSNPDYIKVDWKKYPSIIGKVLTIYDSKEKTNEEPIDEVLKQIQEKR
jgi:hypothetical protein